MNKYEDSHILIADLCERFTTIFQEIKQLKESRLELEQENEELKLVINEEIISHQTSIDTLQKEIIDLTQFQPEDSTQMNEEEIRIIQADTENEKILLEIMKKKNEEINNKISIITRKRNELKEQIIKDTKECENINLLIEDRKKNYCDIEKKISDFENNNLELKQKNFELREKIDKNEKLLKASFEEKFKNDDNYKSISNEYRELLRKNSNIVKNIQELEKENNKNYDELKIKMQRLDVLLKINTKLSTKLSKYEEKAFNYEQIFEENKIRQHENQILQEKIEILIKQPLDNSFKTQIKKLLNHSHQQNLSNYRPNFSKNLKILNEVSNNSEEKEELAEILRENIYFEEYLKTLEAIRIEKNEEIFINKKKIKEEEEKFKECKEKLFGKQLEKENTTKKLEFIKERITQLENHGDIESSEKKVQFKDGENKKNLEFYLN